MELGALRAGDLGKRYVMKSQKSRWAGKMLWTLFNMEILDVRDLRLFAPPPPRPTAAALRQADERLCLFASWLLQDYAAATADQYVSVVRSLHTDWFGGLSLKAMGVDFPKTALALGLGRKRRPGAARQKSPVSAKLIAECLAPLMARRPEWAQRVTTYAIMAAFYCFGFSLCALGRVLLF